MPCRQGGGSLLLINCNPPVKVGAGLPARFEALAQSVLTDADGTDRHVIDRDAPLSEQLFDVSVRQAVPQIPPDRPMPLS